MATAPSTSARSPLSTGAAYSTRTLTTTNVGLLLIRLIVGIVFIYHGAGKLFGGLHGFAGFLTNMHVPMPMVSAALAACTEFFGGLAVLLGFGVRFAAAPMVINMLVAILLVHSRAFDARNGGMEYPLTLATVLLALVFTGGGRLGLSGLLHGRPHPLDANLH